MRSFWPVSGTALAMAVLTVGVVLAATDARAACEARIALVIGNSDYQEGRLAIGGRELSELLLGIVADERTDETRQFRQKA